MGSVGRVVFCVIMDVLFMDMFSYGREGGVRCLPFFCVGGCRIVRSGGCVSVQRGRCDSVSSANFI